MGAVKLPRPRGDCQKLIRSKRRGFLWAGSAQANGAKCLVSLGSLSTASVMRVVGSQKKKKIEAQNTTCMMLKMLHRLYTSTTSPWATWVQGLYLHGESKGASQGRSLEQSQEGAPSLPGHHDLRGGG
jgi:hypothetical protein